MWHDNEAVSDLIGFQRFADAITSLVIDSNLLPVTIGLFGDWGSGKSSVLRMVEQQLQNRDTILTLRFDGWLFEGYDDAKAALMTTIVDSLTSYAAGKKAVWEKVSQRAISLAKRINWFRLIGLAAKGVLTLTSSAGPLVAACASVPELIGSLAKAAQNSAEAESALKDLVREEEPDIVDVHKSIREFRSEFECLIKDAEISSLVVLIDDLDRCLPESIVSTLEAIKLFLAVSGTAFVIAADERIVRQAIARRYPPESYQEFDIAQEYLDKLVQIPCVLPPMDAVETETYVYLLFAEQLLKPDELKTLCDRVRENRKNPSLAQPLNYGIAKSCLDDAADGLEPSFGLSARIAPMLARNLGGNPRLVKRFLNTLDLRLSLGRAEGMTLEHGILAKLMVLERFHKEQFEELYGWQVEQNGCPDQLGTLEAVALQGKQVATSDTGAKYVTSWTGKPELLEWLKMDPSLAGQNLTPYFYLAREHLRLRIQEGGRLSQEQQELFAKLQSTSLAVRQSAADSLSKKPDEAVYPVYDALLARAGTRAKGSASLEGLIELAYKHEGTAKRLLQDIKKLPLASLDAKMVPRFGRIRQEHSHLAGQVDKQLSEWAESTYLVSGAAKAALESISGKSNGNLSIQRR